MGCSGEVMDEATAGNGEIGSVEQALGNTAPSATTGTAIPVGLHKPGSCVITHNSRQKLVVARGFVGALGVADDEIYVYDPIATTWTTLSSIDANDRLSTARGSLRGVATASNKCVFVGGADAEYGSAIDDVDELSVDANNNFVVTAKAALNTARSEFEMSFCGSKLIVFGGMDSANDGLRSVEVSDSLAPTSWTETANALATKRFQFGLAKDPSNDRYVIAAGGNATNAVLNTLETITTSSCAPTSVQQTATLTTAVVGGAVFPEGSTDVYIMAGGAKGGIGIGTAPELGTGDAESKAYQLSVNWSAGVAAQRVAVSDANAPDLNVAVYLPTVVQSNPVAADRAHMLLGGTNADMTPSSASLATPTTNAIQQYEDDFNWHTASLSSGHIGGVAELISGTVFFVAGKSVSGGVVSIPTTLEVITP